MPEIVDDARQAALTALNQVREGGYANLVVKQVAHTWGLTPIDAAFVTELVFGVCRHMGTLDLVIQEASGRSLKTLQPGVVDVLRLGTEQLLKMRVPTHAAVSSSVSLASARIGRRVSGVVNAILRQVADKDWDQWVGELTRAMNPREAVGVRTCHPEWIVDSYARCLPAEEVEQALEANNVAPQPTLVVRPGLMSREELLESGGEPTPFSEWGVIRPGDPSQVPAVRDGRAGVQDEGSQLVAGVLAAADAPGGPWLDMCAGPGGKAALLTGLALRDEEVVVAAEVHPHRADLVVEALRGYGRAPVMVADGRKPAWGRSFSRVLVDAPCTGLGALRRRPEARWRRRESDIDGLARLQRDLLRSGCESLVLGGVVAYVTCSPDLRETSEIVDAMSGVEILDAPELLPALGWAEASSDPRFIQLWPHRDGTDAMFCALLRRV